MKITVKGNTKQRVLKLLASIFDPLGIISPITMCKDMYRQTCNSKLAWDSEIPTFLLNNWIKWSESLPPQIEVPRSIPLFNNAVQSVDLRVFRDASKTGVSVAVYAIAKQTDGSNQGLLVFKSRSLQRKIFQYQDLSWLLQMCVPIFSKIQEQL